MSDDWQAGDLALCVSMSHNNDDTALFAGWSVKRGGIYRVIRARFIAARPPGIGLWFEEDQLQLDNAAWDARDFRKIRPHAPDAEDAETIRLLNSATVREPV